MQKERRHLDDKRLKNANQLRLNPRSQKIKVGYAAFSDVAVKMTAFRPLPRPIGMEKFV